MKSYIFLTRFPYEQKISLFINGGNNKVLGSLIGATLLQHNLKELNDITLNNLVEKWDQFESNYNKNFTEYFERTIANLNKVRTILNDRTQNLTDIFQPTSLHEKIREGRSYSENIIKANEFIPFINEKKCVWITGHGGIGKSTLLKYTMLTILTDEKKSKNKIPVYIELRKYNHEEVKRRSIQEFIYDEMKVSGFELEKEIFKYMLKKGRFLFLFDAYDEIVTERSHLFLQEFEDFLKYFDKVNIVISSRFLPKGHLENFIQLHELRTNGLTKEESLELIEKTKYDNEIKDEFIRSLSESLYDEYESIASNPTLLLLMLSLFRENSNFPKEKSAFLIKAFEELFERHDGRKIAYTRDFRCKNLSKYQMMKVFSAFCFQTYFDTNASQDEFSEEYIKAKLQKIINVFSWLKKANVSAEDLIYDFRVCLCILYKEGDKLYFVHNIFQEFFSAYHIYKSDNKTKVKFLSKYVYSDIEREFHNDWSINFRIIHTTFNYIGELDSSEDQRIIKFSLLLPLLDMIEANELFNDYHHLEDRLRFNFLFTEENIIIQLIPLPSRYQKQRALMLLYNLYSFQNLNQQKLRIRAGRSLKSYRISKEEYDSIIKLPLISEKFLKDMDGNDRQTIEVSYEDIKNSSILYNIYRESSRYKTNEKLKELGEILRQERLQRDSEEDDLI
ncbi:NACHT domain-containing protein [Rossellomorea marisflavi]|uniref:NACHT domain-containing protein n=1 Tax=Rossellomorea marisflavi TaxID=189381 RepID=UPI0028534F92|nr:NACHT domain-containing protein [Rossellomorea marisflavi]MDR4935574.1 NACHT domain-containing protein [Rossellomorea marisflavi]